MSLRGRQNWFGTSKYVAASRNSDQALPLIPSLFLHADKKTKGGNDNQQHPTTTQLVKRKGSFMTQHCMKLDSRLHNTALYETVEWIALSLGMLTVATLIRRDHIPLS